MWFPRNRLYETESLYDYKFVQKVCIYNNLNYCDTLKEAYEELKKRNKIFPIKILTDLPFVFLNCKSFGDVTYSMVNIDRRINRTLALAFVFIYPKSFIEDGYIENYKKFFNQIKNHD